jgi:hypothetical protein
MVRAMNIVRKDLVLEKITSGWNDSVLANEYKSQSKWLRLMVNHVKTREGVPLEYQEQIRGWIAHLTGALGLMEEAEATQAVSSIDHANRKLESAGVFGAGLNAALDPDERKRITRSIRPLKLRVASAIPKESPVHADRDDVQPGGVVDVDAASDQVSDQPSVYRVQLRSA